MEDDIKLAKSGNQDAIEKILSNHKQLVNSVVRKYFLIGGDVDDLTQEGMIALYNAILSYDHEKNSSFDAYAHMVVERHIISTIKQFNNKKNLPLNEAVTVNNQGTIFSDGDDGDGVGYMIQSTKPTPESALENLDTYNELMSKIKDTLSNYENEVLSYYLEGYSYIDIANKLNETPKSVDNALNRIKNKLHFLKNKE